MVGLLRSVLRHRNRCLAVLIGSTLLFGACSSGGSGLGQARAWIDDDQRWETATESGETMALVTRRLLDEADASGCPDDVPGDQRCRSLRVTAAWAEVSAVSVLTCTRPGVFALRAEARIALDALADGGVGLEQPPPIPVC